MAQNIKLKRSSVAGKVPTTAQLEAGEIAINTADGKLYFERDDSTVQTIVTTNALITGSIQVTGGFTGSLFGTSSWSIYAVTASYASNVPLTASYALQALSSSYAATATTALTATSASYATSANAALTSISASHAATASSADAFTVRNTLVASGLTYPTTDGVYQDQHLLTDGAGTLFFADPTTTYETIYNGEATSLIKGTPVYVSGSNGANPKVYRADASNAAKMPVVYIVSEEILTASTGRGILLGTISGIDLTGYTAGDAVYVAPGGGWTTTRPTGTNIIQFLGIVTKEGSGGKGLILNPGPATLPNLTSGNAWVGNSSSYPVTVPTASFLVTQAVSSSLAALATTASYALTASSVGQLNQNVVVNGNLTVYGTSSFTYVTSSQLNVDDSFISVNVFEPVERFGGLKVYDSGSSTATASLAWDSLHNHWVYQNASGSTYSGGMLLSGPRNTGSLGDEPNLAKWFVPRSDGGDHLDNSQIYSSGSVTQITGSLTVSQNVVAQSFTGSFLGTLTGAASTATSASFATYANSAGSATTATSASYALTASYVNPLNQSVIITGSLTVGATGLGASESTLTLGPPTAGGAGEGGQLGLNAAGGAYTSASFIDNWQNQLRILRGTNAGSDAIVAALNLHTKQMTLPAYTGPSSFSGSAAANLSIDSSGNIITTAIGSALTGGATNYLARWASATTLTTGSIYDDGTNVGIGDITPSYKLDVAGDIRATGAIYANANGAMYFQGGDDVALHDINVANTLGVYGMQDATVASIKLGSGGGIISGKSSKIGIGTTDPVSGSLEVSGNVYATSFTGSLLGNASTATSASFATLAASATSATTATNANNINVSATTSTDTTTSVVLVADQATGNQSPFIDSGLTYNANTNALTATTFVGALTGNADTATALTSGDKTITGNLTVTGKVTAEEFHTEFVSASIVYQSGSTKFGNTADDRHSFTGSLEVQGGITGSLSGNASTATSASYAATASVVLTTPASNNQAYDLIFVANQTAGTQQVRTDDNGNITFNPTTGVLSAPTLSGNATTATSASFATYATSASTAATWTTPRTITIGATGKSVNGSADVSWTLGEIGAQATGSYVTDAGGAAGQVGVWSSATALSGSNGLYWGASGLGVFNASPSYPIDVTGKIYSSTEVQGGTAFIKDQSGVATLGSNTATRSIRIGRDGTSNDIFITGSNGNVGFGTANPQARVHASGSADVLLVQGSGSTANTTIFAVDGNNGRLFEISDDLSDSLFSVNTIAGLPVIEAFADNTVTLGAYNQYDLHITGSKVGFGVSAPIYKVHVNGTIAGTSLVETSARKFKRDIEPVTGALETTTQLQGVTFMRIGGETREYGFIADEVQKVAPDLVTCDENGEVYGVHYARTVAILTEAVKELNDKVNSQELFIKDLLGRIEKLENK